MPDETDKRSATKNIAFHLLPPERTPDDSDTPSFPIHLSQPSSSRTPSPFILTPPIETSDAQSLSCNSSTNEGIHAGSDSRLRGWEEAEELDEEQMPSDLRAPYKMQNDGKSKTPLLKRPEDGVSDYDGHGGPGLLIRPPSIRDPDLEGKAAMRKRYTTAAAFLVLSLIAFTIQTETAVYIQHNLHWNKAYCMLYLTHGSWSLLWPTQLLILRLQKWNMPWKIFWRRHVQILRTTAQMVEHQDLHPPAYALKKSPIPYMARTTAFVTCALTVAGGSWYVAVNMTTASDLTAIYNCSAFFAYAFAIPMLGERLRWGKLFAVAVAIAGVLVVAYGDVSPSKHGSKSGGGTGGQPPDEDGPQNRTLGNIVIGVGSVLYGFYEVLYKKVACPPNGCSPGRGTIFAITTGSLIGWFTLFVLWIPIPILHFTGLETFELPRGRAAWMLLISVLANASWLSHCFFLARKAVQRWFGVGAIIPFSGSFLVLISLTSPVLSSVAALLTIFLVALVDQVLPPPLNSPLSGAAIAGGCLIIAAFLLLAWFTYSEMGEERRKKMEDEVDSDVED